MSDVEHPAHYGGAENPYEAIKVMRAWHGPEWVLAWCVLNAEKYLCRAGKKGSEPAARDLRKAAWYAERAAEIADEIAQLESASTDSSACESNTLPTPSASPSAPSR